MLELILTSLFSALAGGAAGYLVARYRWQDELEQLEEHRQKHRRERLEWHRERFQDSTSRIHRPAEQQQGATLVPLEDLEQLRLEMTILKEDLRLERELLEEENREMRMELESRQQPDAVFIDLGEEGSIEEDEAEDTAAPEEDTFAVVEPVAAPVPFEADADREKDIADEELSEETRAPATLPIEERDEKESVRDEATQEVSRLEELQPEEAPGEKAPQDPDVAMSDADPSDAFVPESDPVMSPSGKDLSVPGDIKALFDRVEPAVPRQDENDALENSAEPDLTGNTDSAPGPDAVETPSDEVIRDEDASGSAFSFHWESRRPAAPAPSADRPLKESTRTAMPAFRSLYDMLNASGVSAARPVPPDESEETTLVRDIVGLDGDSFQLLQELGYATLKKLSTLSRSEIRRLAAVFRIREQRIEQDWKPTARAHVNMMAAEGSGRS